MSAELLTPADRRWQEALDIVDHDVYHLPGYVTLEAVRLGGVPSAALVEADDAMLLLPLVIREIPDSDGVVDAVSPYGYPGPVTTSGADPGRRALLAGRLVELLRERNVCTAFIRGHPLLTPERALGAAVVEVEHGETVWLDLTLPEGEQVELMSSTTRNLLRRTSRAGHVARVAEEHAALERFHAIYVATMDRLEAASEYFFTLEHLSGLRDALGDLARLVVVESDGEITAGALFFVHGDIVQYHLSAAIRSGGPASPTRVAIDFARRLFADEGRKVLHLGGGLGGEHDSLFEFKASFSPRRAAFRTLRIVADEARYEELLRRSGIYPADASTSGFFPLYRSAAAGLR